MQHILDQLGKGVAVYPSVWHHAESCLLANRRPKGWLLMAAEFLKTFPMLEDVLIESWQEGIGMGNPFTSRHQSGYRMRESRL